MREANAACDVFGQVHADLARCHGQRSHAQGSRIGNTITESLIGLPTRRFPPRVRDTLCLPCCDTDGVRIALPSGATHWQPRSSRRIDMTLSGLPTASEAFEAEVMRKYGISRVPAECFLYRSYRYTNLADAIAQAKRDERPD
jgi:hypothetical protein